MRRTEAKMDPLLVASRDQVLSLKHNLNAHAIQSLEGETLAIAAEVAALVPDIEESIQESDGFISMLAE